MIHEPLCPAYQTETKLARITPCRMGFEIRTFYALRASASIKMLSNKTIR
jgi:hypothetical protein